MSETHVPNIVSEVAQIVATIRENGQLPPLELARKIGSPSDDHFLTNMQLSAQEILVRCHGNRGSHILDIGSGCGRLSLPFSHFLGGSGRYVGIDVWQDGLDWCRANINGQKTPIEFYAPPVQNNYYFETDNGQSNNFRLDSFSDNSFDIGVAVSVFNHLKKHDVVSYIKELSRLLKPGAVAYITGFVIDDAFFDYVSRTNLHTHVKEDEHERGCFYAYKLQDFFAGYTLPTWYEMFRAHGLRVACFETGNWAQKKGSRMYQDSFIVEKRR